MSRSASLMIASLLMLATACGQKSASSNKNKSKSSLKQEESIEGKYKVRLDPLNSSLAGISSGLARIHVIADQIAIHVDMKETPALTAHAQHIYSASECPKNSQDSNDDGFLDPVEAADILGQILIPLDGNLHSQEEGMSQFPVSDGLGSYRYYQEGSFSKLLSDLQAPDINPKDELAKLNPGQDLKLDGKVLVVQGVAEDIYLPGSIRALGQTSERKSLIIACGKIERVLNEDTETSLPDDGFLE